jgi:hypothetical protein
MLEFVRYGTRSIPGSGGTKARAPTFRKIRCASRISRPTRTERGPSRRAWPSKTVQFAVPLSHCSTPRLELWTIASFRALIFGMSAWIAPSMVTPHSELRRETNAARALATRAFVGMQPVFTQVPPKLFRSMAATCMPALAKRTASGGAACPVPMTIASNRVDMVIPRSPTRFLDSSTTGASRLRHGFFAIRVR